MDALDRFFPRKVCINLQRRPDRWSRMLAQFGSHGLPDVIRQEAADGRILAAPADWRHGPGAYGCVLSHLEAVRSARELGCPAVLILEDDVILHPEFRQRFAECAAQVPDDWDALYLGGIHLDDPEPVSGSVARLKNTFSTYAYGLRSSVYSAYLEEAEKSLRPADHLTRAMQREHRFYCFTPHLAWVSEDYSDIKNANVNPWWLEEPMAMNGEKIQRVLAQTLVILLVPESCAAAENQELVACVSRFYADMNLRVRFLPPSQADPAAIRALMDRGEEYAVIADLAVYPYQWEFKASLLKCLEFDRVLPARRSVALSLEDTRRVLQSQIHDVDTLRYEHAEEPGHESEFCILSRRALLAEETEPPTFHSPARLLRLHPEGRSA